MDKECKTMKKFLALIFSSALIIGACGNDDASNNDSDTKSENKTEKKSEDKKDNKSKDDKKSKEEKKSQENKDNKSTQEENSTEEQETATNEQVQSQQQTQETATQEQQQTQQDNQQNYNDQQSYHEPTKDEIYEWDKQNIPGGTDYGLIDPEDVNEPSDSQNEEPDEWIKGQEEWANATQSEKEEIRKRDAEKYGYEYDPSDYEE